MAASKVAAACPVSLMRQQVNSPSVCLVIEDWAAGRSGCGAGFEFDGGAQLGDRGVAGQLGVVGIRARPGVRGDGADLIQ